MSPSAIRAVVILKSANSMRIIPIVLKNNEERSSDFLIDFPEILRKNNTGKVPRA